MVWDSAINQYKCNKCGIILTEKDNVVQVQFGYLMDNGQSFECGERPDRQYHLNCYKTGV